MRTRLALLVITASLGCSGGGHENRSASDPSQAGGEDQGDGTEGSNAGADDSAADGGSPGDSDGASDASDDEGSADGDDGSDGPTAPADPNVPPVDCGEAVLTGNVAIGSAEDWAQLEGITQVVGALDFFAPTDVPPLDLACIEGDFSIGFVDAPVDLGGFASLKKVSGDVRIVENKGLKNLRGLEGLLHIGGELLVDENEGLEDFTGLSSLARVDGGMKVWRNRGFVALHGLERVAHIGDVLWVANQPLENLRGLSGLGYLKGLKLVSVAGLTSLRGLTALTAIDYGLWLDELHELTDLSGLEYIERLAFNLDIDGAANLRSLAGLGVTRFEGVVSIQRTGIEDLSTLHGAEYLAGDAYFGSNPNLTQCEVDELEQALRAIGWEGSLTSDASPGECAP